MIIRKKKVYSVSMTEEELRLFSEFLDQREFSDKEHSVVDNVRDIFKLGLRKKDAEDFEATADNDFRNHRMTKGYFAKNSDKMLELEKRINSPHKATSIDSRISSIKDSLSAMGEASRLGNKLLDIHEGEQQLNTSGYDDKYSSKGMERLMEKRLKDNDYKDIVDKRLAAQDKYAQSDDIDTSGFMGKVKNAGRDLGRKFEDSSIVYEAGTDGRSLGKDAAMVAGGLAATGLAVHAIRKHRKAKKQAKKNASDKFKTSEE